MSRFIKDSFYFFLVLIGFALKANCQFNNDSIESIALEINAVDSVLTFGKWSEIGETETQLNYLGMIETERSKFKILTSIWF